MWFLLYYSFSRRKTNCRIAFYTFRITFLLEDGDAGPINNADKKILIIDLDGTLCEDVRNEDGAARMLAAKPFRETIKRVNRLGRDGHYVCIFTARTDEHADATLAWLAKHRVRYDKIVFNKPRIHGYGGYYYIDNVSVGATHHGRHFAEELV